ncbi:hypothetical protein [Pedobacter antarcticus]|uniref:hypothetical protein n=1 Tax=Pedobacter antarcticus TaxID=34086 RepID=UPI002930033D|nr:hypothetical protein [Pedobacter antarcticus]
MKVTEVRIDNYVKGQDGSFRIHKVSGVEGNLIKTQPLTLVSWQSNEPVSDFDGHSSALPIPIDETWLLKFGWDRESETIGMPGSDALIVSENNCSSVRLMDNTGNYLSKSFNCVHELQNLYFGLTGEELEFKK